MKKTVWITWENHRRSNELAKAFDAELFTIQLTQSSLLRYPLSIIQTIMVLIKHRPNILFVQNPSMILAALASLLKPIFQYKLIVDRHSNFRFSTINSHALKWRVFHFLSKLTIRKADITIVTVDSLKGLVDKWQGRGVVLQDKIPEMTVSNSNKTPLKGKFNIVCVTTFAADEPIFEIVEAAKLIGSDIHVYMTGSFKKFPEITALQKIKPENVTFTGFVSDVDYANLLDSANAIVVLTLLEELLTCGAYEAIALNKPMILSNTKALSSYFYKGAAYANPDRGSISEAIINIKNNHDKYLNDVINLRAELNADWLIKFNTIVDKHNL